MAIKIDVELDCDKIREQLREIVREIVDEVADNRPIYQNINTYALSPNSEQVAREIAQLISDSPINKNHR